MFLVDTMCGRLARWLRILGYDAEWVSDQERQGLIVRCLKESRTLITRDHRFQKTRGIQTIVLESDLIAGQIRELVQKFGLKIEEKNFFSRCTFCNLPLVTIDKKNISSKAAEYVIKTYEIFYQCPQCLRIYWNGTHKDLFEQQLWQILK